eukprot:CAMPEP_0184460228 /NCGR_PEP_ID=MMETSP0740-20130409/39707_1 /TAXON_ID=385413 /ORGANISM="Thalassiosira miniscula, Strain CCMP1093" /LENGTH=63 /DNA_ID=CAMNT_0026833463 /DNA_START=418 /DNA_END=609 /DNA_ORIENTATION=+
MSSAVFMEDNLDHDDDDVHRVTNVHNMAVVVTQHRKSGMTLEPTWFREGKISIQNISLSPSSQ